MDKFNLDLSPVARLDGHSAPEPTEAGNDSQATDQKSRETPQCPSGNLELNSFIRSRYLIRQIGNRVVDLFSDCKWVEIPWLLPVNLLCK